MKNRRIDSINSISCAYLHFHREFLCSNQLSVQKTAQASSINNNTITHVYQSKVCVYCRILFERNGEYIYYKALDACIRCKNDCHFGSNGIFQFLVKWCGNASNIYSVRNAWIHNTCHVMAIRYLFVFVEACRHRISGTIEIQQKLHSSPANGNVNPSHEGIISKGIAHGLQSKTKQNEQKL